MIDTIHRQTDGMAIVIPNFVFHVFLAERFSVIGFRNVKHRIRDIADSERLLTRAICPFVFKSIVSLAD